jgi:hypothetical protein
MTFPALKFLMDKARRRFVGPRKFVYIATAIVVIAASRLLNAILTSPETEESIQNALLALSGLNPLNMASIFLDRYFGCDHNDLGGEIYVNCSAWRFLDPRRIVAGVMGMFYEVWVNGNALTQVMLLLSVAIAVPSCRWFVLWAGEKVSKQPVETGVFEVLAIAALVPFAASVTGLILQAAAWLLVLLFGYVVGIIAAILVNLAWLIGIWRSLRQVDETAKDIEALHRNVDVAMRDNNKPPT